VQKLLEGPGGGGYWLVLAVSLALMTGLEEEEEEEEEEMEEMEEEETVLVLLVRRSGIRTRA